MIAYCEHVNQTQRSQEEVVQAPPIAYLVIPASKGLVSKIHQHLKFGRVDDEDKRIIMKIVVYKCKK